MDVNAQLREVILTDERPLSQIAELAKLHKSQVSRFVNGRRKLTAESLSRLLDVMDVELVPRIRMRPRVSER